MSRIPLIGLLAGALATIGGGAMGAATTVTTTTTVVTTPHVSAQTVHRQPNYTLRGLKEDIVLSRTIWLGRPSALPFRAYEYGPGWISTFAPASAKEIKANHLTGPCIEQWAFPPKGSHRGWHWIICQSGQSAVFPWTN